MGNLGDQGKKNNNINYRGKHIQLFFPRILVYKACSSLLPKLLARKIVFIFSELTFESAGRPLLTVLPHQRFFHQKSCTRLLADFWLAYLSPLQLKIALFLTECLSKYKLNSNFGKCKLQGTAFKDCHKKF